jgi:ubiquinol-cytochrome c reductase iron-sulfur subunit
MSDVKKINKGRRNLVIGTCAAGGVAGVAAAVPFAASWLPSERAKAGGAPVVADISTLEPGQIMTVEWRSKPVWIVRRTKAMLDGLAKVDNKVSDPHSDVPQQPEYAKNEYRSIKPDILVLVGICTHLGCSPEPEPMGDKAQMGASWEGGWLCPCHGSRFDLAGRVYKGSPAPINLEVPKYTYLSDTRILIGDDTKGA